MILRKRILFAIGAIFATLVLVLYVVSRVILIGNFQELEEQYVHRDVERARSALFDEIAALDMMLFDWAAWDSTYDFIQDINTEYITSNLVDETFISTRLDLILFANRDGQIVFSKTFDRDREIEAPTPVGLRPHLQADALFNHPDETSHIVGVILLPQAPLLVASRPLLTSQEEGPIQGTMIMGRYLDANEVERLSESTHSSLIVERFDASQIPADFEIARNAFLGSFPDEDVIFIHPLNRHTVAGYTIIKDVYGDPALFLRVDVPRDIYQRGQTSMLYLVFLLLIGGLAATGMTSVMANRIVISRLERLNVDVSDIGVSKNLSDRVAVGGDDELTNLARALNDMLETLERSQAKLLESEERYRTLFERTANPILVIDTDGRYIDCNEAALAFLECSRDILLTKHIDDFTPPDQADELRAEHQTLWKRGGTVDTEYLVNGQIKILELTITPATWQNERVIFGVGKDVTQRKRAEQALRKSEQRFRDVARTTGDWIWEMDPKGVYTYVSPVVEQALGYTPEEMIGRSHTAFLKLDKSSKLGKMTLQAFDEQSAVTRLDYPYIHRDGHVVIHEMSGLTLRDEKGRILGCRGVCHDVTAQRQMEERLATVYVLGRELVLSRNVQQIAQSSIQAARLMFDSHLCELWLVDEETQTLVRQVVQTSEPLLPIPRDSLPIDGEGIIATVARSGELIYAPDVGQNPHYLDSGIDTRSEICAPLKVKERVIGVLNAESGRLNAFNFYDQQLYSSLADQAALALENAQLYEKMQATQDRLQTLSHRLVEVQEAERRHIARELHDEIGQILTGLKLIVEMNAVLPPEETRSNYEEALALVNELMTQIRNLSLNLRPTTLDDLGLAPALRWHFERYTNQTNVRVAFKHTDVEGRRFTPQVETGAYRIIQEALTNVARHAGVKEVTVRLWADPDQLNIQIEDRGRGFDAETILSETYSSGISGMIERVTLLGGQLSIESSVGKGARLMAEIPLSKPVGEEIENGIENGIETEQAVVTKGERV
ncbi:MAG TPA: PAS domain S-box protein [Chloroflexi bacterium]|nr:PAS domain S-box protein [Chloroflexota bacterium]